MDVQRRSFLSGVAGTVGALVASGASARVHGNRSRRSDGGIHENGNNQTGPPTDDWVRALVARYNTMSRDMWPRDRDRLTFQASGKMISYRKPSYYHPQWNNQTVFEWTRMSKQDIDGTLMNAMMINMQAHTEQLLSENELLDNDELRGIF